MTIQDLIDTLRSKVTPEQEARLLQASRNIERRERMQQYEEEARKRATCSDCGVDTRHYSHTFRCYWRGIC